MGRMHIQTDSLREQFLRGARTGRHEQSQQTSLALLILAPAVILSAGTKPNFTGIWKLDVAKSDLGSAPIQALVVEVEHREPVFKYVAKGVAGGQQFEEQESLTTDGKPGQDSRGATVVTTWDGDALVTQASGGDGSPLYESRISISADGKTITRVFVTKRADDPQTRRELYEKQAKGDI